MIHSSFWRFLFFFFFFIQGCFVQVTKWNIWKISSKLKKFWWDRQKLEKNFLLSFIDVSKSTIMSKFQNFLVLQFSMFFHENFFTMISNNCTQEFSKIWILDINENSLDVMSSKCFSTYKFWYFLKNNQLEWKFVKLYF